MVVSGLECIDGYGLPLDQRFHAFLELTLFHVAHVHQVRMPGLSIVLVHQQFDQFAFPGQLVLLAHDLQEGDGVGEVEITEVEALGGDLLRF